MPQELLFLVELFSFHRKRGVLPSVRNGMDKDFNIVLKGHVDECRGIIMNTIYSFQGDYILIANYISYLHLHLVDIDEQLIGLKRPFPKLSSAIADISEFSFKHYPAYFNMHSAIPQSVVGRRLMAHKQKVQFVLLTCESFDMLSGLFILIKDYINRKNHTIFSFYHMHYYTLFVNKVYEICVNSNPEELESKVWSELVYINYNSSHFNQLIVQAYQKKFRLLEDRSVVELAILQSIRTVKQFVDHSEFAFDPTTKAVKHQMLSFLYTELEYIQKTKHL
jgi:hypothetical protein